MTGPFSIVVLESDPLRALDLEFMVRQVFAVGANFTYCPQISDVAVAALTADLLLLDAALAPPGAAQTLALLSNCPGETLWISDGAAPAGLHAHWLRRPITHGDILALAARLGTQRP